MRKFDKNSVFSNVSLKATEWIRKQYLRAQKGFRFSPQAPVCLIGSCCAALASELLNDLSNWPSEDIETWTNYIQSFQRDDGWFEDAYLKPVKGNALDSDYMRGHATFLAVMALDALGYKPIRPLEFLNKWRDDERVYKWIDRLDWTNPWRESNWVEWVGYLLLADANLSVDNVPLPKEQYPAGFGGLMQWLEDHQDSTTGFWGDPPYHGLERILHQMAAAYHHYVFYYATGHPIRYQDRIIDHTITLQQPDGLFFPGRVGGGPCEDLDAIDVLANMHRLTDYRSAGIKQALTRALFALLSNQRADGAFVYAFDGNNTNWYYTPQLIWALFKPCYPPGPRTRIQTLHRYIKFGNSGAQQYYAGCRELPFRMKGGDMFSQWFRPLGIAIAACTLGVDSSPIWWPFKFRKQITQGWFPGVIDLEVNKMECRERING